MSRTFSGKQKHRTSLRQTSVLSMQNIRTFALKHPYFYPKKSDVLQLPDRRLSPPLKKVFPKSPTFPTPTPKTSCIY